MIERDDNGTIRITDHSSNGTSVEKETLGKGNSKILNDGEHITVFQRQKTASQDQNGPGAVIEYVFRRRDDKPETRAVAQALERQNAQLEADLRKAREEVDKLLGQLREASTSKATLTRDAAEAIAAADLLRDARQADQACLKAVACARDLAQRVAADAEGRVASLEKKAADSEAALEEAATIASKHGLWLFEMFALRDLKKYILDADGRGDEGTRRLKAVLQKMKGPPAELTKLLGDGLDAEEILRSRS